jgi:hypothetical protein
MPPQNTERPQATPGSQSRNNERTTNKRVQASEQAKKIVRVALYVDASLGTKTETDTLSLCSSVDGKGQVRFRVVGVAELTNCIIFNYKRRVAVVCDDHKNRAHSHKARREGNEEGNKRVCERE